MSLIHTFVCRMRKLGVLYSHSVGQLKAMWRSGAESGKVGGCVKLISEQGGFRSCTARQGLAGRGCARYLPPSCVSASSISTQRSTGMIRRMPRGTGWKRLNIAPALRSCGRSRFRPTTAPRMERLSSDSGATRTDTSRWPQTFWTNNSPVDLKASGSFAWCFCRRRVGPRRGHVAALRRA